MVIKVQALKMSAYVEELVREEFPYGGASEMENEGGIDYELCLHQDFLFMVR